MKSALLFAALFAGQADVDSLWVPWLGCWQLVENEHREPLIGESDPTSGQDVPERGLMCLSPSPDGEGVTVTTVAGGEAFLEETLIADTARNPSTKGNCNGWQTTEWSNDGFRLFTKAELTCEDNRKLEVSGLSMMTRRSTWVDIQIVESEAGRAVLIRRYRPADEQDILDAGLPALPSELAERSFKARFYLTNPLDTDDVIEAAQKVAPEAVEAAVLEHEEAFELNADALMRMADAGIRPGLIDLMVALSYPEQFVVKSGDEGGAGGFGFPGYLGVPSSMRHPYYLAPFSYYYWYAPYDSRYVIAPVSVRQVSQGLVSQQGYAQVSPRPGARRARFLGGNGSGGGSGMSSGGSSGGSVSGQGYSSGGSSGRTAKPKKNN